MMTFSGVLVCDEDRDSAGVLEHPVEPASDAVVESGIDESTSESSERSDEEQGEPFGKDTQHR